MTQPDDDWSDLSRAWTEPAPHDAEAARADAALIRAVRRRDRLARVNYGLEILGGVVVVAVIVWVALRTALPWPVLVAAFAFIAFGLGLTVWARRGDVGVLTGTPEDVLRSAIAQTRTGERWALGGIGTSLAAFAFLVLMSRYDGRGTAAGLLAPVGLALALCVGGYGAHALRCRRRRRAHEAALGALVED